MASKVVEICEKQICPIINNLGYEVVEVEYAKKVDGMNLTFYIDSPQGIVIEDCEKVNDAISDILDEINPTNDEHYILNVSSPGLDRPIKNERDFLRNKDKKVEVSLYVNFEKSKKHSGLLKNWTENSVQIEIDGRLVEFEHKDIAQISPIIEF